MGSDEPGQLYAEEMTAWDSFSHPKLSYYCKELEQKRVLISFAFALFEYIVCYDRRPITDVISKPKVKVVEHDRDGIIPCLM